MKSVVLFAAALASFATAIPANAVTLRWTLHDVTFDDGGSATGRFTINSKSGRVTGFDMTTTAGSAFGGLHYTSAGDGVLYDIAGPNSFAFVAGSSGYINLVFVDPVKTVGVDALAFGDYTSYECNNCSLLRQVTGGFATVVAVPEPATWGLLVVGFGLVGIAARRRDSAVAA